MYVCFLCSLNDFIHWYIITAVVTIGDVVSYAAVKKHRLLLYEAQLGTHPLQVQISDVVAIYQLESRIVRSASKELVSCAKCEQCIPRLIRTENTSFVSRKKCL